MTWLVVIVPRCTVTLAYGNRADGWIVGRVARLGNARVAVDTYPAALMTKRWGVSAGRW